MYLVSVTEETFWVYTFSSNFLSVVLITLFFFFFSLSFYLSSSAFPLLSVRYTCLTLFDFNQPPFYLWPHTENTEQFSSVFVPVFRFCIATIPVEGKA